MRVLHQQSKAHNSRDELENNMLPMTYFGMIITVILRLNKIIDFNVMSVLLYLCM